MRTYGNLKKEWGEWDDFVKKGGGCGADTTRARGLKVKRRMKRYLKRRERQFITLKLKSWI
jgi:hypothetical protein